ncbi:MAG TPA: hypothetical protein VLD16_06965 [Gaiellaceae bacterium]|nr:hypothetical protein [Gaiellaceae bacterium]
MRRTTISAAVVRCLDCGAEYRLESRDGKAGPCPRCGGVGWVALDACGRRRRSRKSS